VVSTGAAMWGAAAATTAIAAVTAKPQIHAKHLRPSPVVAMGVAVVENAFANSDIMARFARFPRNHAVFHLCLTRAFPPFAFAAAFFAIAAMTVAAPAAWIGATPIAQGGMLSATAPADATANR
jgi:hypothetical protein